MRGTDHVQSNTSQTRYQYWYCTHNRPVVQRPTTNFLTPLHHTRQMRIFASALLLLPATVSAYGPSTPDSTADIEFICKYRSLGWEYAKKIQPNHDATLTFDAFMLGSLCNQTRPHVKSVGMCMQLTIWQLHSNQHELYR